MDWITTIGLVAATLTTASFLPQAVKTIRTKETEGLSLVMYIVLTTGIALWLLYGILTNDVPVIMANGITLLFTMTILIMVMMYRQ